jgi:hypothetical protein
MRQNLQTSKDTVRDKKPDEMEKILHYVFQELFLKHIGMGSAQLRLSPTTNVTHISD